MRSWRIWSRSLKPTKSMRYTPSSGRNSVLLDSFCGCGAAVHAAQRPKRKCSASTLRPGHFAHRNALKESLPRGVRRGRPAATVIRSDRRAGRLGCGARSRATRQVSIPVVGGLARGSAAVPGKEERRGHRHRWNKILSRARPQGSAQIVVSVKGGGIKPDDVCARSTPRAALTMVAAAELVFLN